ncbi:MAG TPA: hypothetical protein DIT32_07980 [Peptococcaceae bacterium]|nr:hypothetical protein [Peptococcaceae bacterium]
MKKRCIIFSLVFCLTMLLSLPLLADGVTNTTSGLTASTETMSEIFEKLRIERANLVGGQTEVMTQANEAKIRVEAILNQSIAENKALTFEQLESLKKDLATIKSAQDILNTVLTDIRTTTTEVGEYMPIKEYLYKLINLYSEKALQLYDVADTLKDVAVNA